MRARRCVRAATTTEVIGESDGTGGGAGRAKRRERVARRTTEGDVTYRTNSGVTAGGVGKAMRVVAAVVAVLDVVVGRERGGGWEDKGWTRLKTGAPRVVAELLSGRPSPSG